MRLCIPGRSSTAASTCGSSATRRWTWRRSRRSRRAASPGGSAATAAAPTRFCPFETLSWAVTGKMVGGKTVLRQPISREDALIAHTRKNAYFVFQENNLGSIQPGKLADLVVTDRDYLTIPADQIKDIKADDDHRRRPRSSTMLVLLRRRVREQRGASLVRLARRTGKVRPTILQIGGHMRDRMVTLFVAVPAIGASRTPGADREPAAGAGREARPQRRDQGRRAAAGDARAASGRSGRDPGRLGARQLRARSCRTAAGSPTTRAGSSTCSIATTSRRSTRTSAPSSRDGLQPARERLHRLRLPPGVRAQRVVLHGARRARRRQPGDAELHSARASRRPT